MISDKTYNIIMESVNNIINMNIEDWNLVIKDNKIKILHNICNDLKCNVNKGIIISLKSLKPKKFIQYCNFSKLTNKLYYNEFKENILNYTFEFRNKYVDKKKRIYYTYNNLSNDDYNKIINDYNVIVYNFLIKYQKYINTNLLYNMLLGNNKEKIICDPNNKNSININIKDNAIILNFNKNITIVMKLLLKSNIITNNLPVVYSISVTNDYSTH